MRTARLVWLMFSVPFLVCGCERIYYRDHGFEWNLATNVSGVSGVRVDVTVEGTWATEDSAGFHINRKANPYRIRFYARPPSHSKFTIVDATLVELKSGSKTPLELTGPVPVQDRTGDVLVEVKQVELSPEDYLVRVSVRFQDVNGNSLEQVISGTLEWRFSEHKAFRKWDELMGI